MENIWIQFIITAGVVIGGMFVTIRYAIGQSNKKEKSFLDYLEKSQTQQLDYYTNKNGIIEKISSTFSKTVNKNTKAIEKLTGELKGDKGDRGAQGIQGVRGLAGKNQKII